MKYLSNELLLESYYKAIELDLSQDFIELIKDEMHKRELPYKVEEATKQCQ